MGWSSNVPSRGVLGARAARALGAGERAKEMGQGAETAYGSRVSNPNKKRGYLEEALRDSDKRPTTKFRWKLEPYLAVYMVHGRWNDTNASEQGR